MKYAIITLIAAIMLSSSIASSSSQSPISITFINHRTGTARICVELPGDLYSVTVSYYMRHFSTPGCFIHPPPGSLVDINDQILPGHVYAYYFPDGQNVLVQPHFATYMPIISR